MEDSVRTESDSEAPSTLPNNCKQDGNPVKMDGETKHLNGFTANEDTEVKESSDQEVDGDPPHCKKRRMMPSPDSTVDAVPDPEPDPGPAAEVIDEVRPEDIIIETATADDLDTREADASAQTDTSTQTDATIQNAKYKLSDEILNLFFGDQEKVTVSRQGFQEIFHMLLANVLAGPTVGIVAPLMEKLSKRDAVLTNLKEKMAAITKEMQNNDLKRITKRLIEDRIAANGWKAVTPLRVTRSVGLQVTIVGSMYTKKAYAQKSTGGAPPPDPSTLSATPVTPKPSTFAATPVTPKPSAPPVTPSSTVVVSSTAPSPATTCAATVVPPNSANRNSAPRPTPTRFIVTPQHRLPPATSVSQSPRLPSAHRVSSTATPVTPQNLTAIESKKPIPKPTEIIDLTDKEDIPPNPTKFIIFKPTGLAEMSPAAPRINGITKSQLTELKGVLSHVTLPPLPSTPPTTALGPPPPAPDLTVSKDPTSSVVTLSWNMKPRESPDALSRFEVYTFQHSPMGSNPPNANWKKIGHVNAAHLPMTCTLSNLKSECLHYIMVRAIDSKNRFGDFSSISAVQL